MHYFYASFRIGLKILLWVVLWAVAIALPVSRAYGDYFGYSQLASMSFSQCLLTNFVRGLLYLLLFVGVAYVVRADIMGRSSGSNAHHTTTNKFAACVGVVVAWLCCWTVISEVLYVFGVSRFMSDCDAGHMECACDNRPFLYPLYVLTLAMGCYYFTKLYLTVKRGAQ